LRFAVSPAEPLTAGQLASQLFSTSPSAPTGQPFTQERYAAHDGSAPHALVCVVQAAAVQLAQALDPKRLPEVSAAASGAVFVCPDEQPRDASRVMMASRRAKRSTASSLRILAASGSFEVESKLSRSMQVVRDAGVDGTPTLIVNGKYRTSGASAGGYAQMLELVGWLVEKEHAAAKAPKAK
jgi:protein-disulfide isomerase-like protein with CxxC motif